MMVDAFDGCWVTGDGSVSLDVWCLDDCGVIAGTVKLLSQRTIISPDEDPLFALVKEG